MATKQREEKKASLQFLADNWRSGIVPRSKVGEFTGDLYSSKTLANLDSLGEGPEGRLQIGGKVAYLVPSFIAWLERRIAA